MDGDDCLDLFGGHVLERGVTQDAGVVHENVDLTEGVHGCRHDRGPAALGGDRVAVGDRRTARGRDLVDHCLCCRDRRAAAVHRTAEVVDHDAGTPAGEFEGVTAAEPTARTGDDGYLIVESHR